MSDNGKKVLLDLMKNQVDGFMNNYDFSRRGGSLNYSRKINTTKQTIEMVFFSHPAYQPGAIMHIYPWMSVYFPEVNEMAKKMVNSIDLLAGLDKYTIRQPIQLAAKSEPRWMLMDKRDCNYLAEQICVFLERNTIPLLNSLTEISDFIRIFEKKDERTVFGDAQYVFLISAYVLQGNYEKAMMILEHRFGKKGLRRQYGSIFSYLENELRKKL